MNPWWRFNPDEEIRRHQRSSFEGDIDAEVRYLMSRIRAGNLDPYHVQLAAFLGHPASLEISPTTGPSRTGEPHSDVSLVLDSVDLDLRLVVTIAADFAEHVLHIWEAEREDDRPSSQIRAARYWVASGASDFPILYYADLEVGDSRARSAAWSARDAMLAARAAGATMPYNPNAAYGFAARAAAHAVQAADDEEEELKWQRQHLIEVLLA